MDKDGRIVEQYEMPNSNEEWTKFREKYIELKPEIAMEMSTSGKYVARVLRNIGFSIHIADPALNDEEDAFRKRSEQEVLR